MLTQHKIFFLLLALITIFCKTQKEKEQELKKNLVIALKNHNYNKVKKLIKNGAKIDYLTKEYVKYIRSVNNNPNNKNKSNKLRLIGYKLYKMKKDRTAVKKYNEAFENGF